METFPDEVTDSPDWGPDEIDGLLTWAVGQNGSDVLLNPLQTAFVCIDGGYIPASKKNFAPWILKVSSST